MIFACADKQTYACIWRAQVVQTDNTEVPQDVPRFPLLVFDSLCCIDFEGSFTCLLTDSKKQGPSEANSLSAGQVSHPKVHYLVHKKVSINK
jgi:hypothetical protein